MVEIVEERYRKGIEHSLTTVLGSIHSAISVWSNDHLITINRLASEELLIDAATALKNTPLEYDSLTDAQAQKDLRDVFSAILHTKQYQGYFILNEKNKNIAAYRDYHLGAVNLLAEEPDMLKRLWQGETLVSKVQHSDNRYFHEHRKDSHYHGELGDSIPHHHRETMFVAAPIKGKNGDVIAILSLKLDPFGTFYRLLEQGRLGETGETYAFDQQGRMRTESRFLGQLVDMGFLKEKQSSALNIRIEVPNTKGEDGKNQLTLMAHKALAGIDGFNIDGYKDYRDISVVGAWLWDNKLGMGLATEQDTSEAYSVFYFVRYLIYGATITVALLLYVFSHIITASKKTIEENEHRFRSVIETAHDGIVITDSCGIIKSANPSLESIFGYKHGELEGTSINKLLAEHFHAKHNTLLNNYKNNAKTHTVSIDRPTQARKKDGSLIPVEITVNPLQLEEGLYFSGVIRDISTQIKAKEEIAAKTKQLKLMALIAEETDNIVIVANADGQIEWVNKGFTKASGYSLNECLGLKPGQFLQGQGSAPEVIELMSEAIRNALPVSGEIINYNKAGEPYWVSFEITPVFDTAGQLLNFVALERDITEEKQLLSDLKQQKEAVEANNRIISITQKALERTGIAEFWINSQDGSLFRVNNQACEHLGYTREELLSLTVSDFDPEFPPEAFQSISAELKNKGWIRFESTHKSQSGQVIPVEIIALNFDETSQSSSMLIAFVTDISERKQNEEALSVAKERLEAGMSAGIVGIWDWDVSNNHMVWDDVMYQLFGVDIDETEDPYRIWLKAILPEDKATSKELIKQALKGQIEYDSEQRIIWPDGSTHYLKLRARTYLDKYGRTKRMTGVAYDLTELKESEQLLEYAKAEAEAANRAKSTFLATMSHEIRTPLNGIVGTIDVLRHSEIQQSQRDLLGTAYDSSMTLAGIIDDILDFSKIEAGHMELQEEPFALESLVEGVGETLQLSASQKDIELLVYCDPKLPNLVGDSIRLRQVLYNLVGNAVKFTHTTEQQGRVIVSAVLKQQKDKKVHLCLDVSDNGIGMSAQVKNKIFRPFEQGENSISRKYGGTGLGLVITKRIVEMMEGSIELDSQEGKGSVFKISLSLNAVSEQDPPLHEELDGLNILLIEKDQEIGKFLKSYLTHSGAKVDTATPNNAFQTFELTKQKASEIIVVVDSQSNTPAADKLCEQLRNTAGDTSLRFVLINRGRRRYARELGNDGVTLDLNAMRRSSLVNAVATVAGLQQPAKNIESSSNIFPTETFKLEDAKTNGHYVLIADDNSTNRDVLSKQLNMLGYVSDAVDNGLSALIQWRDNSYNLIITDCHMPIMDGYDLAKAIRKEEKQGQHVPIIAFTADALKGTADKCFAAGMDDYLSKPAQLREISNTLEKHLPQRGMEPSVTNHTDSKEKENSSTLVLVDPTILSDILGIEEAKELADIYDDFLDSTAETIEEIRANDQQQSKIRELAHKLKSSAKTVGAIPLADCCARLEKCATTIECEDTEKLIAEAFTLYKKIKEWISNYKNSIRGH